MSNKGVSKCLMHQLLLHGKANKNIHNAVLFSRPHNAAAIKVYESLGFKSIGDFGLFFFGDMKNKIILLVLFDIIRQHLKTTY